MSLDTLFSRLLKSDTSIDSYISTSIQSYSLYDEKISSILDYLYYFSETLEHSGSISLKVPLQDIYITDDNHYYLISSKTYEENGVIIKEVVIPNNSKLKYIRIDSDNEKNNSTENYAEDSDICDEPLSYQQVEDLAINLIFHSH